jgi:DNA-binding Lrp family transcriptional regulator
MQPRARSERAPWRPAGDRSSIAKGDSVRNPYVTGPFVTGRKFYGRKELIDYLLQGENPACWVIGNRRIGKTSLLRQLELLALGEPALIPLFWDMQGSDSYQRLGQYLADAVSEHAERLQTLAVPAASLSQEDPAALLADLRRAAARAGREILLLCDEPEAVIKIARAEPEAMQRLHREMTAGAGLRVVGASTQSIYELHDVCRNWPTSPFLAGFDMSRMLSGLNAQSAQQLITQEQNAKPLQVAPDVIEDISDCTNNHPYLIQQLCSRLFNKDGFLRPITNDDLEVDPVLRGFFSMDYHALTRPERQILRVAQRSGPTAEPALVQASGCEPAEARRRIHNLERLGYLRRVYERYTIGNQYLANWLNEEPVSEDEAPTPVSDAALQIALVNRQAQEAGFLRVQLNAQRARLVELEAVRARDLLDVSPKVLAEIEELQAQISHLRELLDEIGT